MCVCVCVFVCLYVCGVCLRGVGVCEGVYLLAPCRKSGCAARSHRWADAILRFSCQVWWPGKIN